MLWIAIKILVLKSRQRTTPLSLFPFLNKKKKEWNAINDKLPLSQQQQWRTFSPIILWQPNIDGGEEAKKKKKNFSLFQPFNFYFPQNVTLERFWVPRLCVYKNSISSHCSIVFGCVQNFIIFRLSPTPTMGRVFNRWTGKTCGTELKSWHFQINFCVVLNKLHEKF